MNQTDLAVKAGFNSSRSYWRAKVYAGKIELTP